MDAIFKYKYKYPKYRSNFVILGVLIKKATKETELMIYYFKKLCLSSKIKHLTCSLL